MSTFQARARTGSNYRRAGLLWGTEWIEVDNAQLSSEQKALLLSDPHIQIREAPGAAVYQGGKLVREATAPVSVEPVAAAPAPEAPKVKTEETKPIDPKPPAKK